MKSISIIGIEGLPDIHQGDDLSKMIIDVCDKENITIQDGDIIAITQKIVSKSESCLVDLDTINPSILAKTWGLQWDRDPRLIELVFQKSKRISKMENGVLLTETEHGFYCINAGIDLSNVAGDNMAAYLPVDSDKSAYNIRSSIKKSLGVNIAVIVTDTWGRPWRVGVTNVAIGISGMSAFQDYRGLNDANGMDLKASIIAVVDELAAASELVMNKLDNIPVALIKGYTYVPYEGSINDLIRPPEQDLFR